jgi:hypothetical protein
MVELTSLLLTYKRFGENPLDESIYSERYTFLPLDIYNLLKDISSIEKYTISNFLYDVKMNPKKTAEIYFILLNKYFIDKDTNEKVIKVLEEKLEYYLSSLIKSDISTFKMFYNLLEEIYANIIGIFVYKDS